MLIKRGSTRVPMNSTKAVTEGPARLGVSDCRRGGGKEAALEGAALEGLA